MRALILRGDQPADTLLGIPEGTASLVQTPARVERTRQQSRSAVGYQVHPAGERSYNLSIRPYLNLGFLLTPPSAADLEYQDADNASLEEYLNVKRGSYGAGLQFFLSRPENPFLKMGLDVGVRRLFSSTFDTGLSDLDFIHESYHTDEETSLSLLGIAELTREGSPFFLQTGAGGHLVRWTWSQHSESKYDSLHRTESELEIALGLMAAVGTDIRVTERSSLPISIRLDCLVRHGVMLVAGLVVGSSFQ